MNIHLVLYSNEKFRKYREALIEWSKVICAFDSLFSYDRDWLQETEFYEKHKEILDDPGSIGDGWCLWKPYIIKETLNQLQDGECVVYIDSSDVYFGEIRNFLLDHFHNDDFLMARAGFNKNGDYTKMDCFHYMGCNTQDYWDCLQLEAGVVGFKKCQRTLEFLDEWIKYCSDKRLVTNRPNECGLPDRPGFVAHRYDQSILTILKHKYGLKDTREIFKFIECNFSDSDPNELLRKTGIIRTKLNDNQFKIWLTQYLSFFL